MTCDELILILEDLSRAGYGALPIAGPPTEFGTWPIMGAYYEPNSWLEQHGDAPFVQLTDSLQGGKRDDLR